MSAASATLLPDGSGAAARLVVGPADTAEALGSGDLLVLGTPRLIALMELAARTIAAADLPSDATTVGVFVSVEHLAPSVVGASITATAVIRTRTDRQIELDLEARDDVSAVVIGRGLHRRVVVNRASFLAKVTVI